MKIADLILCPEIMMIMLTAISHEAIRRSSSTWAAAGRSGRGSTRRIVVFGHLFNAHERSCTTLRQRCKSSCSSSAHRIFSSATTMVIHLHHHPSNSNAVVVRCHICRPSSTSSICTTLFLSLPMRFGLTLAVWPRLCSAPPVLLSHI